MFWFVLSVIGFVLFLVLSILATTAPPPKTTNPADYSVWDHLSGEAVRKMEAEGDAERTDQMMKFYLWLITVGLLVASIAAGVYVFGDG
ncbi:hypothetical protein [Mycolicibacterium wolinskyi]|uniref:hypothetical protein n=1 Tax=Mycolicibacterium wolinskyi TaxID=59750 RepID=UPI003917721C